MRLRILAADGKVKEYPCRQLFFAKSKQCPTSQVFDHMGFVTTSKLLLQLNAKRLKDGIFTQKVITEDPNFPKQQLGIVELPRTIKVQDDIAAKDCSDFVFKALKQNDLNYPVADLVKVLKLGLTVAKFKPKE
jgi:hypothetical protein